MAGGLMQLVAYGAQDVYLTGNPQITFFKVVYRRHTNFAIETIEHTLNGTLEFGTRATVTLPRNADLVSKMYLKIVLNEIDPAGNSFAWVKRIGHAIIQQIEVEIGGTIIDRQNGTWLDIWYELARSGDHERGYARLIGDVPELTSYNTDIKEEYTLFIPLQFWFNRYIGLAVPLIALQFHDLRIHIDFSPSTNLFIRDCNFDTTLVTMNDASILVNYVYLDSEERRRFAQVGHEYLIEQIQFDGVEAVENLSVRFTLDYNHPTKEIIWALRNGIYNSNKSFIFYTDADDWEDKLEDAGRLIIEQSISVGDNPEAAVGGTWIEVIGGTVQTVGTINVNNLNIQSVFVNPESLKIDDYGITDKVSADIEVDVEGNINFINISTVLRVRDLSLSIDLMEDTRLNPCDPVVNIFSNYGVLIDGSVNPVQSALLKLNGHDRFDRREGTYFNNVQSDQHHSNTPKDGINVFSFSLLPEEHQPSGTANLSRIDETSLSINFFEPTQKLGDPEIGFLNADNQLFIFGTNYNILRILSGLAGIAYSTN